MNRRNALEQLLSELEEFEINLGQYWEDLEPQTGYDSVLSGKLDALGHWCQALGWSDLAKSILEPLPLRGSAPEMLTRVQSYLIPEIRHNLKTEISTETIPLMISSGNYFTREFERWRNLALNRAS